MAERHAIPVEADQSVAAVHHEGSTGDWLVFCHGFRSDKSGSYEHRCLRAVEEGYHAVRFDFRGCGESDGEFADSTLSARLADLASVVEHFDLEAYVLFGSSFGGTVALHRAAADDRVEAVATRAPVTYARAFDETRAIVERDGRRRFDDGTSIDRRFVDDLDRHRFADVASRIDVPVAIAHGRDDASVPLGDSLDAAAALETDVLLEAYAGEGHRFTRAGEERLLDRTFDWLATVR